MLTRYLLSLMILTGWGSASAQDYYAAHSVLSQGRWAKIRIPESGIYELTDSLARAAGFDAADGVRVFGYGGALQPEKLTGNYLAATDDLKEVPMCLVNGRRLFRAQGPVSWADTSGLRTRNPYSVYGYYFLTDGEPQTLDSAAFVNAYYPAPDDYCSLYEVDDYAWYHGGRNLYDQRCLVEGESMTYQLPAYSEGGILTVVMSYAGYCDAVVELNDSLLGHLLIDSSTASTTNRHKKSLPDQYSVATADSWSFTIPQGFRAENTITIRKVSGEDMRLDYLTLVSTAPKPMPSLTATTFPIPEFAGIIEQQDHHADTPADMIIIVPASRKLLAEAERLGQMHETCDGLRVRVVIADQLYNEFSSGTPDANAYRRYLKMLYDRAADKADAPRFLLLFGDAAWDNRMLSSNWKTTTPDDFLLCYESDNSFSVTQCYVSDDYFCLLDDGEGSDMLTDRIDVAVGRFPVRDEQQARIMVDKAISYRMNEHAGPWQNTLCFMSDDVDNDKNKHVHLNDTEDVVKALENSYSGFNIQKIYWDSFTKKQTSTGETFPDVERLIRQQMQSGALVMNYSGHGAAYSLGHELVVFKEDFAAPAQSRFPLWVTASCDIMPFDGQEPNIGEEAVLNETGGAIAFFGTTRTVYAAWNRPMNKAFMLYVLGETNGRRNTLGEAVRLAKNSFTSGTNRDQIINKQHFALLGDPALVLAAPALTVSIDSVNGQSVDTDNVQLAAGSLATITGHIDDTSDFNGRITLVVKDVERNIVQRTLVDTITVRYKDRPQMVYTGTDSIRNGRFSLSFVVPKDITYADGTSLILAYAVNDDNTLTAHGQNGHLVLSGYEGDETDCEGPVILCYLNSPDFENGGKVDPTPSFHAELSDENSINVADGSIGHYLSLVIDGQSSLTYNLNDYFQYRFGDYRRGTVDFVIPHLSYGRHRLQFRAWDVLNNSSVAVLDFLVDDPSGISTVVVDDGPEAGEAYDLMGRRLSPHATSRSSLILKRDHLGQVKKMVKGGQ